MATYKKMWALVKWIDDSDVKTYTVGIDVTHIKDFDCEKFLNDENVDPEHIYVVEWHNAKKKPLGGWPCYNAMVIAVSSSKLRLEKTLKALDGIPSPAGPPPRLTDDGEKMYDSDEGNGSFTESIAIDNDDYKPETDEPTKKKMKTLDSAEFNDDKKTHEEEKEDEYKLVEVTGGKRIDKGIKISAIPREIKTRNLTDQFVTIDVLKTALADVMANVNGKIDQLLSQPSTSSDSTEKHLPDNKKGSSVMPTNIKMKELGQKGSEVFITRPQWEAAKSRNTFTSMTTALLVSAFPEEILLKSNYKGGKTKINDNKNVQYKALDSKIINAIKESVQAQHPGSFKNKDFGTAINTKCAKLREAERKKKAIKQAAEGTEPHRSTEEEN